jgi:hypothetical protein
MFSMITNIYNKKAKGPTLKELFTATGKLKKFLLTTRDVRCVHHGRDTAHIDTIFKFKFIFFTAAMISAFRHGSLQQ